MKTLKIASFFKIFTLSVFTYFAPLHSSFVLVAILVFADTITGVMKAGKNDVRKIWSRKLFGFVPKLIFYFVLIICADGISKVEPTIPFVKFGLLGIAFIEIKSIDENFRTLFGFSFIDKALTIARDIKSINRKQ